VDNYDTCVRIFSEDGVHLKKLEFPGCSSLRIAFHHASEHFVIAGVEGGSWRSDRVAMHVAIFTKDGEFVHSSQIPEERILSIRRVAVTMDGRIAVLLLDIDDKWKVLVI